MGRPSRNRNNVNEDIAKRDAYEKSLNSQRSLSVMKVLMRLRTCRFRFSCCCIGANILVIYSSSAVGSRETSVLDALSVRFHYFSAH